MSLVNPNRWSTVRRLFESAIDMPTVERGAYLQAECADDSDTRHEVMALLAADEVPFDMPVDRDPDTRHTDAAENFVIRTAATRRTRQRIFQKSLASRSSSALAPAVPAASLRQFALKMVLAWL